VSGAATKDVPLVFATPVILKVAFVPTEHAALSVTQNFRK